jgi:hypothetical protein
VQAERPISPWQADAHVERKPRAACLCRHTEPAGAANAAYIQERSDWQSPRAGVRGREESMARAKPVPSFLAPRGAARGGKAQPLFERVAEPMGGRNAAWQPSRARGQSGGDAVSAAALTGPRAAALTGTQFRPLVREPVVGGTPRRHRLGGVHHGAVVDDGGVGPRPALPIDPAAKGLRSSVAPILLRRTDALAGGRVEAGRCMSALEGCQALSLQRDGSEGGKMRESRLPSVCKSMPAVIVMSPYRRCFRPVDFALD